jgi:hypothetical protein
LTGASVVVIPAGVPRKPGMTRDDLFNVRSFDLHGRNFSFAVAWSGRNASRSFLISVYFCWR